MLKIRGDRLANFRALVAYGVVGLLLSNGCGQRSGGKELSFDQQYAAAIRISDPAKRARQLIHVARQQSTAGDSGGARRSLETAWQACGRIQDPLSKSTARTTLATAQAELGQLDTARRTLADALQEESEIPDEAQRVALRIRAAVVYGRDLKDPENAKQLLSDAEKALAKSNPQSDPIAGWIRLGLAHHELQQLDRSRQAIRQALEAARRNAEPRTKSDGLALVAAAMSQLHMTAEAQGTFAESLQVARAIADDVSRAHALTEIANQQSRSGDRVNSAKTLEEAGQAADRVGDQGLQREIREKIEKMRTSRNAVWTTTPRWSLANRMCCDKVA